MRKAILGLAFLLLSSACQKSRPESFYFLQLPAVGRPAFALSTLRREMASVFVFLAPDCPLSQNYTRTLNDLYSAYASRGVGFFGVIAGQLYDGREVDQFVAKYKIAFPVLLDHDFALADFLEAQVTPEAFAVGLNAKVVYKGAIDNWAESLGQHRVKATDLYLADALDDILEGRNVRRAETPTVGCFIERKSLTESGG